ncbi:hypothetical protein, partial [Microcoleus sp.]|uniref:hypothetical protein n=1 Tax=Microcoleus sp. TaxID=44472 RepID=UPI00403E716D
APKSCWRNGAPKGGATALQKGATALVSVRGPAHPIDKVCASWTVSCSFSIKNPGFLKKPGFFLPTKRGVKS